MNLHTAAGRHICSHRADCHIEQIDAFLIMLAAERSVQESGLPLLLSRKSRNTCTCAPKYKSLCKPNSDHWSAPQLPYLDLHRPLK